MSYLSFMPWTLQKRLLRYLLSQLDFLETEDLDLENLGITWGQRSVVELKSIGLRTKKLSSILRLPSIVTFISARISHLKLTVPADILTSGIVVEISGVDIRLKIEQKNEKDSKHPRADYRQAPSVGTKSNRPRRGAPSVHDPGGYAAVRYGAREEPLFHPEAAAQHLAESFLQTESKEDRLELEAVLASQSRHGRESPSSSVTSEGEVGIGAAEGYTLPSFIASYVVGIADRLQLRVSDIAVHAEFHHLQEGPNYPQSEINLSAKLLLKLSELIVEGVDVSGADSDPCNAKRRIDLHQFSVLILPDPTNISSDPASPETTSPFLEHPQSSFIHPPSASDASEHARQGSPNSKVPNDTTTVSARTVQSTLQGSFSLSGIISEAKSPATKGFTSEVEASPHQSTPSFPSPTEITVSKGDNPSPTSSIHASTTSDDDVFEDPLTFGDNDEAEFPDSFPSSSVTNSRGSFNSRDVDNQIHARAFAGSYQFTSNMPLKLQNTQPVEDLTESKIFTHDEAESMYLSAMTGGKSPRADLDHVPGGWDWSREQATAHGQPSTSHALHDPDVALPQGNLTSSAAVERPPTLHNPIFTESGGRQVRAADDTNFPAQTSQTAKQLVLINRVTLWLPVAHNPDFTGTLTTKEATRTETVLERTGAERIVHRTATPPNETRDPADERWNSQGSAPASSGNKAAVASAGASGSLQATEVEILHLHFQFDMQLGQTLVAMANSVLAKSADTAGNNKDAVPPLTTPRLSVKVSTVVITFLEHVKESSIMVAATQQTPDDDALLLTVALAGLQCDTSSSGSVSQQHLQLAKVSLSHSRGQFLSFSHDLRMRTSLKDTFALQRNDIEVSVTSTASNNKIEVTSKPVRLRLELGQVDDILSRSGGLSSLLELGSSIASSGTVRTGPSIPFQRRVGPRGVRFEDFSPTESKGQDDFTFGLGKVNIRIGGLSLDMVGSECALKATTSAVKIVYRSEGLGMQVDKASLQGPYLLKSNGDPDLSVKLQSIRVEYLPVPKDHDLDRLLEILTPSKDKYDSDDDIMLDTLLQQRRKGGVLRMTVTTFSASLEGVSNVAHLTKIGTELGKLSSVAKYLPEDDRSGVLSLGLVKSLELDINLGEHIGRLQLNARTVEGAHVNVPSLLAAQAGNVSIRRNETENLLGEAISYSDPKAVPPMVMCRFLADEMDPTVKLKLFNICLEYHVPLVVALLKSAEAFSADRSEDGSEKSSQLLGPSFSPSGSEGAAEFVRRTNISLAIRDSALALNPRGFSGRALFVLTDGVFSSPLNDRKDLKLSTELRKASVMVINRTHIETSDDSDSHINVIGKDDQMKKLAQMGYVSVGYLSSVKIFINIARVSEGESKSVDMDLGKALLILETCADSTQTLIHILSGLAPPTPPAKVSPYRTEIMPIEDLLASFSGDAFISEPGPEAGLRAEVGPDSEPPTAGHHDIEYVSEFYQPDPEDLDDMSESGIESEMLDSELSESTVSISVAPVSTKQSVMHALHHKGMTNSLLDFREEHFGNTSAVGGTAHRWDSTQNTYGLASERYIAKSPLKVRVRDVHIIWNLFDGYDWQSTRDTISEAVRDIETRAAARRPRSGGKLPLGADDDEEAVIGDFLFNSIYIGISPNKDPHELAHEINRDIDDLASETGSYATSTTITGSPAKHQAVKTRQKKLKLKRSKQHKMTFELKGVSADMLVFPPDSGEVQSSIDIRVKDVEVFDHLPTSTWKKFATYMRDAGEREADTSMAHVEILNVKPVPDLAASEMILKITVLPLRLHVDQDALDFMSRFFEFKDDSAPAPSTPATPSTPPFLQRVEVNPIKVKLDFKPKRVDYGGLRSGRTTEFMNFFVLDQADMVLRRVILYGVSGFDRLGIMLNNIWTPDVKRNQLPGILAGLAPIRSLVNVGSGVKDLVVVPMREYKKDGRIVRSIQKGALAFAKTTSKELIGLGAKLAIGTQAVLQSAETMLNQDDPRDERGANNDDDDDEESHRQISLYADQPVGVVQGLRGAYASLERDLLLAKDAIIAVPGEAMASGSAAGAARAVLKQAPTVILRPAIGASKAVGQTLLGAGNTLDRENWRRVEEKYKRH